MPSISADFDAGCRRQSKDLPAGLSVLRLRGASTIRGAARRSRIAREAGTAATIIGTAQLASPGRCGLRQRGDGARPGARGHARRQHLPSWRGDLADAARAVGTDAACPARRCSPPRSSATRPARRSAARSSPPTSRGSIGRPAWWRRWARRWREAVRSASPKTARPAPWRSPPTHQSGLNEWPHAGGSEMYFHPGFAARNAITAIELAEAGACASETILEGEAGLFAAFRRQPRPPASRCSPTAEPEIMAVYNKPAPACNFAQTAAQSSACASSRELGSTGRDRPPSSIRVPEAAARYPGCDSKGPFRNALQAKMSIPFSVAAVLARGAIEEENYADARRCRDPAPRRGGPICRRDPGFTAAFPASRAPRSPSACAAARTIRHGASTMSLPPRRQEIRARFRAAAAAPSARTARRSGRTHRRLRAAPDSRVIAAQCRLNPPERVLRPAS